MKRFWDKVEMRGPDDCWEWRAGTVNWKTVSYGAFGWSNPRRMIYAHRVAYFLQQGQDPSKSDPAQIVRHKCHNGLCCNPLHLEVGTTHDNWKDMEDAGRSNPAKGSAVGSSCLKEQDIPIIRARLLARERCKDIAKDYNVSVGAISSIRRNSTWRHVT